jgi:DNA-binding beta-propeller fold protein YncE
MSQQLDVESRSSWKGAPLWACLLAAAVLIAGRSGLAPSLLVSETASRRPTGQPQLLAAQPLPPMDGPLCEWVPASLAAVPWSALQQDSPALPDAAQQAAVQSRPPLRVIRDPYPAFSSVAVDLAHNEVIFTDENLFQLLVYDRTANTPPGAMLTEPKRIIGGHRTKIEFNCDVYVDPRTGDIYTISHDSEGMPLTVFDRQANGDVAPTREIDTPKGTYGLAVDEEAEEIFMSIQHDSAVVVFKKYGERDEPPIRLIQGDQTLLGDAHGIALDTRKKEIFVSNYGYSSSRDPDGAEARGRREQPKPNWPLQRSVAIPGTGKMLPPSINVYPLKGHGDIPPLRLIQGPKTQLNMPSHLFVDEQRGELYVANDMGNSILVFDAGVSGDVAPKRMLKGPKTRIQNPTGLFVDLKNDELWVANFGAHAAVVFDRTAEGDTPPLRMIRNGPIDAPSLMIGNPGAVGYDTKREEILVPN